MDSDRTDDRTNRHSDVDEEHELGSAEVADRDYNDDVAYPDYGSVAKVMERVNEDGTLRKVIRASKSDFVHNLIFLDGTKFSFAGRNYLRPIYNRNDRQILLKTARQVEKCCHNDTPVLLMHGNEVKASNIVAGDMIIGMEADGRQVVDEVVRSESNGMKPCLRIKTRLGSDITVTRNHPLRSLLQWSKASSLRPKDKIASLRTQGTFGTIYKPWAWLLGAHIADGHYTKKSGLGFTKKEHDIKACLVKNLDQQGFKYDDSYDDARSGETKIRLSMCGGWADILKELGLYNKHAHEKTIPESVFEWDKESTIELLRGLWCMDGHCKSVTDSKVDLVYSSTSELLIHQVRLLLRKFGVVTTKRSYMPKGAHTHRHHLIRVVTRKSIQAFYDNIAPIHTKPFNIPSKPSNSNLDTLPKEVHELIRYARERRGFRDRGDSFTCNGLRIQSKYCPTFEKVAKMNEYLVDTVLQKILDSDIIWDEITSIEDVGAQNTWALETKTRTYISDFLVNHNTTFLANNLVVTSVVRPYNKSLYVSPSHMQTRQFSNEKLRPAIDKSPLINKYFQDSAVSQQVFEKGFTNGSYIFLRSAFRSADRCVAAGTYITLASGARVPVESLVGKSPKLLSFSGHTPSIQKARKVWSNGVKPCFEVRLRSGHTVEASVNHRWVTHRGIKTTEELGGCWVPIPLNFIKGENRLCSDIYVLGAYFLGDGSCCQNKHYNSYKCEFNNNNVEFIDMYVELLQRFGVDTDLKVRQQKLTFNYTVKIPDLNERRVILNILETLGIKGKTWHNKSIPREVFESRNLVKKVLQVMFECDGWASTCGSQVEVGWVSGSIELAKDVLYALQGLGIYAVLDTKKPGKRSKNLAYQVKIRSAEYIKVFEREVGFLTKDKVGRLKSVLKVCDGLDPHSISLDMPAREVFNSVLERHNISDHQLWDKYRLSYRRNSKVNQEGIARHKIEKLYEITQDKALLKYISKDIFWLPVKSVLPTGDREVFDLSVEEDEVFTANGVFTHNTRGISARVLTLDEIQDMITSELPVIMECTSHFLDANIYMAGTPKSYDNTIEIYWQNTTQNEWLVPCKCGKWNFLDEHNIGPTEDYISGKLPPGPICKKCHRPIDAAYGRWVSFNKGAAIQGYRIPQLMVPWICGIYDQWLKLLWKRDNYPFGQFYNEVLGFSYDSASKPITREDLLECCCDYELWKPGVLTDGVGVFSPILGEAKRYFLTAGIDWGEGNDGSERSPTGKIRNASYSVLTVGAYMNQKDWRTMLVKKYEGREVDPDYVVRDVARICKGLNVRLVGADWGHGWGVNNQLVRILGPDKVVQYQHLPKLKKKMVWDPLGSRYHLLRNFMMSECFFDIKSKFIQFPRWAQFEKYAKDILGIYSEYLEYRREIKYDHRPSDPDDFFHSLLYAKLTSDVYLGKSRRYTLEAGNE